MSVCILVYMASQASWKLSRRGEDTPSFILAIAPSSTVLAPGFGITIVA